MNDEHRDLATTIEAHLKRRGWQQKTLAHEWHQAAGKKGGMSTFESRLSNLMNDEEDGYGFLLDAKDASERLEGLAKCLEMSPDELRSLVEASRARPTLVFGVHIPEDQRRFFEKRAAAFPALLRCVAVDQAGSTREGLRDAAKKYRNSFVIVGDDRDKEFYAGADVSTKRIEKAGKGFHIKGIPEISLQRPARTVDDEGMPMFPDAELEERYRSSRSSDGDAAKWIERIRAADAEDTPVTFRHDWLLEARGCRPPMAGGVEEAALVLAAAKAKLGPSGRWHDAESRAQRSLACLWWYQGRVLAFPEMKYGREAARPVEVHDVTSFAPIVEKLATVFSGMNPVGTGSVLFDLSAETQAFAAETGLVLEFSEAAIRAAFDERKGGPSMGKETVRIHRAAADDDRVRGALDEILARQFDVPLARASAIWMLELLRDAPLLHSRVDDSQMEAVADLGTGNVLRFEIHRFASEGPTAMRFGTEALSTFDTRELFDGGDIRITWSQKWLDDNLEGTSLKAVERRREQARRARDDDD